MPALWQCNISRDHRIIALVTRLKFRGRLNPKQIVVAAMRKAGGAVLRCSEAGKPFDPALAMGCRARSGSGSRPGRGFDLSPLTSAFPAGRLAADQESGGFW
jgi:hypothetical protein